MTTQNELLNITLPANADLSSNQFYAVTQNASGKVAVITTTGAKALGLLQNKPAAADRAANVATLGVAKGIAGGTIAYWEPVGPDTSGKLVVMDEEDEAVMGRSLESAVTNQIFRVLLTHEGSAAAVQDVDAFVAAANYATTGQYLCVKPHTVAGEVILVASAQDDAIGILQNAPAAGATALVQTYGPTTGTAGTGGFAAGDRLAVNSSGKLITATTGRATAYALAAVLEDATGAVFFVPSFLIDMTGQTLASAKLFVGDGSNLAAAVTMSGDVTNDNAGAQTIANDVVGVAKMASTVAGSDGCIFKSTATPNAVTELDVPTGNVIVGTSGDVGLLDMGAAAGNIMVDSGTAPASVAMSGDATLAADGTLTIANDAVSAAKMGSTVAGSDGAIFKSTSTPDAVTELDVPTGNLLVGTAGDVGLIDMGAAAGNIMVDSGTAPASVAVSGDATLAADGTLSVADLTIASEAQGDILRRGAAAWERHDAKTTGQILVGDGTDVASVAVSGDATLVAAGTMTLAKGFMRQITTNWSAAEIIAGNVTPLVLADFSVLQAAGIVAAGDALIFHHLVANIYGGAANYDNNENSIIKYQTAGGGATVSLTLANWFNGSGAGTITDIKQLATVVVPDADEDLVWTMSASPFAAAGDRLLRVTLYYSVYTPAT
jgi:hypothetical protein